MLLTRCLLLTALPFVVVNHFIATTHATSLPRSVSSSSVWSFTIDRQLHSFRSHLPGNGKITQAQLSDAERVASACGARVAIVQNSIYFRNLADPMKRENGTHCAERAIALLSVFQRALSEYDLPNVEFVLNCGDMPVVSRESNSPLPVLSYDVNHLNFHDIATPFWAVLVDYGSLVHGESVLSWNDKKNIAFFRGSTTGGYYTPENWKQMPRTRIVSACRAEGSHCDAMFTGFPQCEGETGKIIENALGKAPVVREEDYAQYKYNILVDGNGAPASRAVQSVFTNTLLLKLESPFSEFFYPLLQPYVHYVPVSDNATDLLEKISWARENDVRARRIAEELLSFGNRYLSPAAVNEYVHELFRGLALLLESPPSEVPHGFQLFEPPLHWRFEKQKRVRSHALANGHVSCG